MVIRLIRTLPVAACAAVLLLQQGSTVAASQQMPAPINPVGVYTVSTLTSEGQQMSGTLTIQAANGAYTGELISPEAGTVPLRQVTTNARHWMAVFTAGENLAIAWLERQPDGTFTGTWHQLSPGIGVKMTRNK